MYPEYPQNTNQPQDLLGKIKENKIQAAVIGGGGFLFLTLIIVILGVIFSPGPPVASQMAATQEHIVSLLELTGLQEEELIGEEALRQNATVNIVLAGAANDLNNIILNVYGGAAPAEEVAAAHAARLAEIEAAFGDAVFSNTVDSAYQKQMVMELNNINAQLASYVASEETPPEVDESLAAIFERLKEVRERLEEANL